MGTIQNARQGQKMNEIKEQIMSLFFWFALEIFGFTCVRVTLFCSIADLI